MTRRRRTRSPRTLVLVIAAAVGALASVGESLAASGTPTKAQATVFAHAVNLRTGDLPAFKTGAVSKTTPADKKTGAAIARCSGGVDPNRAVIDADSPDFTVVTGIVQQDVSSEVEILPTAALVAKDLNAAKSARGRGCIERDLNKEFAAMKIKGVKFGRFSVATMPLPAVGASGSFAYRFTVLATIHAEKIPYYADILGFTYGRAEVTLSGLGFGEPVSGKDELGLFSVLLRRAEAAAAV